MNDLVPADPAFRSADEVRPLLLAACAAYPRLVRHEVIGQSEAGRPLDGFILGDSKRASPRRSSERSGGGTAILLAGAHADEPVGPETLRALVCELPQRRPDLLGDWRFVVVPHVNPDGEARNRPCIEKWPDAAACLPGMVREPPGRDIEFGYPDLRPENEAVAGFLARHAPAALHMSLHGMAAAPGALLLIERTWAFRTQPLRDSYAEAVRKERLSLFDKNRKGEKGFFYLEPGFWTTPESTAMQTFFRSHGDEATAAQFKRSSMEYVRSLGGDPLCLVTEVPLFVRGESPDAYRPVPLATAMRLQLRALELGLSAVS